jgi:uncharacterized protein (TIGR03086 family)
MSDNLRNYTKALYTMDAVVNRVPADRWDSQSPCEKWTAKEVLGHCVGSLLYVASNAGAVDPPGEMAEADRVGDDPVASWSGARDIVLESLDHRYVLSQEVDGPFGRAPLDDMLPIMTMDITAHSWDIAKAVGLDPVIPNDLAALTYHAIKGFGEGAQKSGNFAPAVDVGDDADMVTKMAAIAGRQP